MERDVKFKPTGLDCSPCWKNTPKNSWYFSCPYKDSEVCKTCRKNCHLMRRCDNCPWLGTWRPWQPPPKPPTPPSINITADAEAHSLPPCSEPTAQVVINGNNLHFIFGIPKCRCCCSKNIEDCDIEISEKKTLNIEDCDVNI